MMASLQPSQPMTSVSCRFISLKSFSLLFFHCFLRRPLDLTPGASSSITSPNNPSHFRLFTWPYNLNRPTPTSVNIGFTLHLLATSSLASRSPRVTPAMWRSILRSHAWIRSAIFLIVLHVPDPYRRTDLVQALYMLPMPERGTCPLARRLLISVHFFHVDAVRFDTALFAPPSLLSMSPR